MRARLPIPNPEPSVCLAHLIPPPAETRKPLRPIKWAVGVMAARRDSGASYVANCVRSLLGAGFPEPVVFAEPGTPGIVLRDGCPVVAETGTPATINGVRLGVMPNHLAMMQSLTRGQQWQDCNAFLVVEDDTVYCPGLRQYLDDYVLWPSDPINLGALCLFTHGLNRISHRHAGWHQLTPSVFRHMWGGQAVVLSRQGAEKWLTSPFQTLHKENAAAHINRYPDNRLSEWCTTLGRPIYFPVGIFRDSPVDHIGHHSSVFGAGKNGRARKFAGETISAPLIVQMARKRKTVRTRPIGTDAQPVDLEGAEARKARRGGVCGKCPAWKEETCSACKCANPPTAATLGVLEIKCVRGLWQEVAFEHRPELVPA